MHTIDYILCLMIIIVFSSVSYLVIEKTLECNRDKTRRMLTIIVSGLICSVTTVVSLYLYMNAGIVRDVPELDVYVSNRHRGIHAEYNDRVRRMDIDFSDKDTTKVLAIGNSFARTINWIFLIYMN